MGGQKVHFLRYVICKRFLNNNDKKISVTRHAIHKDNPFIIFPHNNNHEKKILVPEKLEQKRILLSKLVKYIHFLA